MGRSVLAQLRHFSIAQRKDGFGKKENRNHTQYTNKSIKGIVSVVKTLFLFISMYVVVC